MRLLLLVPILVSTVLSQKWTKPAVKRLFPYCNDAALLTVTNTLNATKTVAACGTACTNFANGKSFAATGAKNVPAGAAAKAITRCKAFCNHRFCLVGYVHWMFTALGTQYFSALKQTELEKLFWTTDTSCNNNFNKTQATYLPLGMQRVVEAKRTILATQLGKNIASFKANNKTCAAAIFDYVY